MDVSTLAGRAIELVADRMATTESPDGANRGEIADLWRMVTDRLARTEPGGTLLRRLREQPGDPGRRAMAASALAQSAAADQDFRAELYEAVYGTPAGDLENVSAGDRPARIGGWIVAGLITLSLGTSGVVAATRGQADPAEVGTERNEDGVRAAATGYLDAFAAKDSSRTCAFIKNSERGVSLAQTCAEYLDSRVFHTMSADRFKKLKSVEVERVEFFGDPNRADAHLTPEGALRLEYENGRWFVNVNIRKLGGA